MFRSILTGFLLSCTATILTAQASIYPEGVYTSFEEIKLKSPSIKVKLEVKQRTKFNIKMSGGNDIMLVAPNRLFPRNALTKEYYGYSTGDTLYVNCYKYKVQQWYTPVLSDGKFIVVRASLSAVPDIQKEQLNNKAQLGYLFGPIVGGLQGAKLAMLRFIYVIDKETNEITTVTSDYLLDLLSEYPDIITEYQAEEEPDNQDTLMEYLKRVNNL